jgi:hypothetical protein
VEEAAKKAKTEATPSKPTGASASTATSSASASARPSPAQPDARPSPTLAEPLFPTRQSDDAPMTSKPTEWYFKNGFRASVAFDKEDGRPAPLLTRLWEGMTEDEHIRLCEKFNRRKIQKQLQVSKNSSETVRCLIWIHLGAPPSQAKYSNVVFLDGSGVCNGLNWDMFRLAKELHLITNREVK